MDHLLRHYGTEAAGIFNLGGADRRLLRRLLPPHPAIEAEVVHAVRRELAQTVEDVMVRRSRSVGMWIVDPNVFETANAGFAQAMYEEFLKDPSAVGPEWRRLFESGVVGEKDGARRGSGAAGKRGRKGAAGQRVRPRPGQT